MKNNQPIALSITIVNWNTREDLHNALCSIDQHPPQEPFEVIVVDNASNDGSVAMVKEEFPKVQLIANDWNAGFTKGHNQAWKASRGEYLFILNSDTITLSGSLQKLLEFARDHPEAGIIGPRLLNPDGSLQYSCRRFPNLAAAVFRNTPLGKLFPQNRYTRDYLMTDWDHTLSRPVDWVSGAALLTRRDLFEQLNGFDEGFYMYCEDVDLCYRAWQAGAQVIYYPDAPIIHAIGHSTDQAANKMIRVFHTSMYRFYRKHYAHQTPFYLRPFVLPGVILRASLFILKNYRDALMRALRLWK